MIRRTRRVTTVLLCSAVAVALVANGCTRRNTTTGGPTNYVAEVNREGTAHWTCTSHGLGGHMHGDQGHESGYANNYYEGRTKGTLSLADCKANAEIFDRVMRWAARYPTKSTAGMAEAVQHVDGLGTHHIVGTIGGVTGNPWFLQYDGEEPNAPLAGMSWFQLTGGAPPEGFAGGNDFWHTHSSLCYGNTANREGAKPGAPAIGVLGNEMSDADCRAKGGFNLKLPGAWMAHAWIVPGYESYFDVFGTASACIMAKGKPAPNDPCKSAEMDDPEHNTSPTTRPGVTTRLGATTRPSVTTRPSMTTTTHGDHAH